VLAVLSTVTVIHRIRYTYQMTKDLAPVRDPIMLQSVAAESSRQARPDLPPAPSAPHA